MATFVKIDERAAVLLVLAAAVIVWAVVAPESFQAAVNAAVELLPDIEVSVG